MEESLSTVEFHLLGLPSAGLSIWHQLAYQRHPHSQPDPFCCCYDSWLPSCTQATTSSLNFPMRLLKNREQPLNFLTRAMQWWPTPSIPELWRQKQADLGEFEGSLVYQSNPGLQGYTENSVSKRKDVQRQWQAHCL